MTKPDKTAADILAEVGRAIFPGGDWQARLAVVLGVRRDTGNPVACHSAPATAHLTTC